MMKAIAAFLVLAMSAHSGFGFTNPTRPVRSSVPRPLFVAPSSQRPLEIDWEVVNAPTRHSSSSNLAGFFTGFIGFIGQVVAADDYEVVELPSPWVPAIFGVVLLAGIGVLTSSLGNVMDEEAGLGMQSGARAKKEIERSRSSYFGKRPK